MYSLTVDPADILAPAAGDWAETVWFSPSVSGNSMASASRFFASARVMPVTSGTVTNGGSVAANYTENNLDYGRYKTGLNGEPEGDDRTLVKSADLTAEEPTATVSEIVNNSQVKINGVGFAYITANAVEDDNYNPGTASYKLTQR